MGPDHMNSNRLTAMILMPAIICTIAPCGMAAFSRSRDRDFFRFFRPNRNGGRKAENGFPAR
jgi:hypothetical protein